MHSLKFAILSFSIASSTLLEASETSLRLFNEVLFYDGYAASVSVPVPNGVIRHRNDLYARKITDQELESIGGQLTAHITIKAACDNYDRIGSVNLAFVPKGATTYAPDQVQKIELGRFITPFMNKNVKPDEVPYSFDLDHVIPLFKDPAIKKAYDLWAELEVFGVPYAANQQVAGCAGRNDVFYGSMDFVSDQEPAQTAENVFLPLNFKNNLNNYTPGASDALGQTVRTIEIDLPQPLNDAKFFLITSNHGANAGGEEYNRRLHEIYFDNELLLTYTPGGVSCEPYRKYNTQANGIYGYQPRTPEQWASFSNWCPGQVIPIRAIDVGNISAGKHSFRISVPTAVFVDAQGYIPVSLHLQGSRAL